MEDALYGDLVDPFFPVELEPEEEGGGDHGEVGLELSLAGSLAIDYRVEGSLTLTLTLLLYNLWSRVASL